MIKEYYKFIKAYFDLTKTNNKYFKWMVITEILYKLFLILITLFASWIIDYATIGNMNMAYISTIFLGASYFLYRLFYFINCKIYGKNMQYCYTTLQTKILNKVVSVDEKFTKKISKGKLLNSINRDVIDIGDQCNRVSELFTTTLQVIGTLIIIAYYNNLIFLLVLLFSIIYLLLKNNLDRFINIYYKKQRHEVDRYSTLFSQILNGLQEIKTFDMLNRLKSKLKEIENKYENAYMTKRSYNVLRDNDVVLVRFFFKIIIYIICLVLVMNNEITVGIVVLLVGYFDSIADYIVKIIDETSTIREVNTSVERINTILNYKELKQIDYGENAKDNIKGVVEFKNVDFGYENNDIIKNLNLKIEPNKITAIVGQSGTGKTSIINLLLRLYKIKSGEILIDGINIYDYNKEIHSSNVAVVNQRPFIFNMSIRKNLDFVDTNISNQIEACKRVGIHDFIESLPNGYNTILRENGSNISGGQKQLISIARTLLSKAEIILLDEVTSSLDPDTAKNIDSLLKDLKRDHTIIMITHKPDLMKKADRIIVLHKGKIVGDGKHKDLINSNEHYKWLQARKSASKLGVFDNDK